MTNANTVTCSFTMDRDMYNTFKSIVVRNGENVKGNIIKYMTSVIEKDKPNQETLEAIAEVQRMKADPTLGKSYTDIDEMMRDLLK